MLLTLLQSRPSGPVPPLIVGGDGWAYKKVKPRTFDEEVRAKDDLRRIIRDAIDPVAKTAQVVTVSASDVVAVLPSKGRQFAIPVPPIFNASEVARLVIEQLSILGVEAQRVRNAKAQERARVMAELFAEQQRKRLLRRRRDEQILLLM